MKKIKDFTPEELKQYRHYQYIKHREKNLQKQKQYDDERKEERKQKAKERYKIKCGLKPSKTYKEKPKTKAQLIEEIELLKNKINQLENDRDFYRNKYLEKNK